MTAPSDGRQTPLRGWRALWAFAAVGALVALSAGAAAPPHGIRSADAASTSAHAHAAATYEHAAATYELVSHATKRQVRWLACRPISYRIDPSGMPRGMDAVVKRVMRSVAKQTGASFRYAGTTRRRFSTTARPATPTIYIAFTAKRKAYGHTFGFPGEIGIGGPVSAWTTDAAGHRFEAITSGRVLLSTAFAGPPNGPGVSWSSLIRHEIGHALNLAHRPSEHAVMNPILTEAAPERFQRREVTALKGALQRSGCDYGAWSEL